MLFMDTQCSSTIILQVNNNSCSDLQVKSSYVLFDKYGLQL